MLAFLSAVDGFYVASHTIDSRDSSNKTAREAFCGAYSGVSASAVDVVEGLAVENCGRGFGFRLSRHVAALHCHHN
jgi:hypothetical protein